MEQRMAKRTRRTHSLSGVQRQSGTGALAGDKTLAEPAQRFEVHPNQIKQATETELINKKLP